MNEKKRSKTKARDYCHHRWAMTNIRTGYLVVEGCWHCGQRKSLFSEESVPPLEDYREGDHFWSYLGSSQSSKFDLRCEKCSREVPLKDVMALMLCARCDRRCGLYKLGSDKGGDKRWVYAALCADTSHMFGKCIPNPGIKALNDYFNRGSRKQHKNFVVSCKSRRNVNTCEGIVLADVGLTEI